MKNTLNMSTLILLLSISFNANSAHIDQLGTNVSLLSSTGTGTFTIRLEEFFGADGWMWGNTTAGEWDQFYSYSSFFSITSPTATLTSNASNPASLEFSNLVNADLSESYFVNRNTQYVNDTSDAARYVADLTFSIANFDSSLSYLIDVAFNDCCYVSASGGPSFQDSFQFDPSVVVTNPSAVPVPAAIWLMGSGLLSLIGFSRKNKTQAIAA